VFNSEFDSLKSLVTEEPHISARTRQFVSAYLGATATSAIP